MYGYSTVQWIFFFFLYSFAGWVWESCYVSVAKRHWVNRGFIRGPFLPIYGSGAVMMLLVSAPFQSNLVLTYLAGCVGATALEYVTGAMMERLFKVRYWDYSNQRFHIHGYICLSSTLAWGFFTILMTRFVHGPVEHFVLSIPENVLSAGTFCIAVVAAADFALSFKAALDLRDVLEAMEKAKEELAHMQKRLDVILAYAEEAKEEYISGITQKVEQVLESAAAKTEDRRQERLLKTEDRKEERVIKSEEMQAGIEAALNKLKAVLTEKHPPKLDELREELMELRDRYQASKAKRNTSGWHKDFIKRDLILGNPGMVSSKYKEFLEEIKQSVEESRKKK